MPETHLGSLFTKTNNFTQYQFADAFEREHGNYKTDTQ